MIPQTEFRDNLADVLRRAGEGEEITITVSGRPVASLLPTQGRRWVPNSQLAGLWKTPPDPTLEAELDVRRP